MKSYEKRLDFWQCLRCDYLWVKRPGPRPATCPGCKNKLWATEKQRAPGAGRKKKIQNVAPSVVDELAETAFEIIKPGLIKKYFPADAVPLVPARPIPQETVVSDGEKKLLTSQQP